CARDIPLYYYGSVGYYGLDSW
nr:immunoglobulin heavy chain junction region [Macaca mulatta]MOW90146.1 immunoglobulin heavy chain junction region [Macaca mulatta]